MKTKIIPIIVAVLSTFIVSSCRHKDLCYAHPHSSKLYVVYDWSEAADATPRGMCVFFYSTDNDGIYHRFDFPNTKGGEIELSEGNYKLITYNNDTELVRFSATDSYDGHKAYTREGDILEPMYGNGVVTTARSNNDERVVVTPDGLWGCHATDVAISSHGVKYTIVHWFSRAGDEETTIDSAGNQTITLYPHDMLCHYTYEVRNVKNTEHVSKISAAISGMAPSMNLADESLDSEPVTLPLSATVNNAEHKITGSFLTFGNHEANLYPHKMSFYVIMDNGEKYSFKDATNLDVTTQVDNAPDKRHVHIIIDGLNLPTPIGSDDGFNPSVDDWGVIHEEIKI